MKQFIGKVNIPLGGVALGVTGLGNLLRSSSQTAYMCCGVMAALLVLLLLLKLLMMPKELCAALADPVAASVAPTSAMTLMLLAAYAAPLSAELGLLLWWVGLLLHLVLMLNFTQLQLKQRNIKQLHASTFVVYVGIAAAAISAPQISAAMPPVADIGRLLVLWGMACFIILLPLLIYRYCKHPVPQPARPLFCIFAAPASLCLVALVNSAPRTALLAIYPLLLFSVLLYIPALINAVICLRGAYYPSFAALTFPFAISATATLLAARMAGLPPIFTLLGQLQMLIAAIFVAYVLLRALYALKPQ